MTATADDWEIKRATVAGANDYLRKPGDLAGMVRVLAPHFAHTYVTRFASNRSVPPEQLLELWRRHAAQPATACADPRQAWQAARVAARAEDLICVTGSVFLAGELRPVILGGAG